MHLVRGFSAAISLSVLVSPAQTQKRKPNRIVYWGNTSTGASVRVFNTPDSEKKAEAEVIKLGGSGWVLLENSATPGFGAAICKKVGNSINFYVAHGYSSGRDAVTAAKAKANGGGTFCSNALWRVAELPAPEESTIVGTMKGLVRSAVTTKKDDGDRKPACKPGERATAERPSTPSAKRARETGNADCRQQEPKGISALPCLCVRG